MGGAAKTVLASAAVIVVGRKFGASAQAALTTRGFSELVRLGRACGARSETMAGLSRPGGFNPTFPPPQSRDFSLWGFLGRGRQRAPGRLRREEVLATRPVLHEASSKVGFP